MSDRLAVWRFGFLRGSDAADAFGVEIDEASDPEGYGFLWVLATRRTGKVEESWRGYAMELSPAVRRVIDWEPLWIEAGSP